jgi:hypothetical protein
MPSPTLAATLAAYAGISGAHLAGHYDAANKHSIPISMDAKGMSERWSVPNERKPGDYEKASGKSWAKLYMSDKEYEDALNRTRADIHGGGFDMQGKITQLVSEAYPDQDIAKSARMAQSIHEALYVSGVFEKMAKGETAFPGGDFGGMEKTSGNKQTRAIVALDAIKNFIMATNGKKEKDWDIRPTVIDGSPGAVFNMRY